MVCETLDMGYIFLHFLPAPHGALLEVAAAWIVNFMPGSLSRTMRKGQHRRENSSCLRRTWASKHLEQNHQGSLNHLLSGIVDT